VNSSQVGVISFLTTESGSARQKDYNHIITFVAFVAFVSLLTEIRCKKSLTAKGELHQKVFFLTIIFSRVVFPIVEMSMSVFVSKYTS
jgi:hypothetical protein